MARRLEDHLDLKAAAARVCVCERKLWAEIKSGRIDPVVELPGPKGGTSKVLIPESSLARWLAQYRVTRNPEAAIA